MLYLHRKGREREREREEDEPSLSPFPPTLSSPRPSLGVHVGFYVLFSTFFLRFQTSRGLVHSRERESE